MFRLTTLKLSLLSAFATLFLLLAMLAFTGTASAHTTSCQPPNCTPWQPNPQITVYGAYYTGHGCMWMAVTGTGFAPGQAWFYADAPSSVTTSHTINTWDMTVNPRSATANVYGNFLTGITVCGTEWSGKTGRVINSGVPYGTQLSMIDSRGDYSNVVYL